MYAEICTKYNHFIMSTNVAANRLQNTLIGDYGFQFIADNTSHDSQTRLRISNNFNSSKAIHETKNMQSILRCDHIFRMLVRSKVLSIGMDWTERFITFVQI